MATERSLCDHREISLWPQREISLWPQREPPQRFWGDLGVAFVAVLAVFVAVLAVFVAGLTVSAVFVTVLCPRPTPFSYFRTRKRDAKSLEYFQVPNLGKTSNQNELILVSKRVYLGNQNELVLVFKRIYFGIKTSLCW